MKSLEPLAHESIYSWVVRYHLQIGVGHEKNTYRQLFNYEKIRIHPYLPNHVQCLDKLGGNTADVWLEDHTLYPLFKFFGHDLNNKLKQAMLTHTGNTVSAANIAQSRLCFEYGHKYCPVCLKEHLEQTGIPRYDIRYQIPGMTVCPRHNCELNIIKCGDIGLDRRLTFPKSFAVIPTFNPLLIIFAQFCMDVFAITKQLPCDPLLLHRLYWHHLEKRNLVTLGKQLRMSLLVLELDNFYQGFAFTAGLESLSSFHFLGPLLRYRAHKPSHPIKHLIFAFWLFDKDASLFQSEQDSQPQQVECSEQIQAKPDETGIIAMLRKGLSMAHIEKITGKSRCYIRRLSEINGIEHKSNLQAFSNRIRVMVILKAKLGWHRKAIAEALNVGLGYVEQVISNTKNLVLWRKKLHELKNINAALKELRRAKVLHPSWLRKDFKAQHNKAFFYLYRHDRELLESTLPVKTKPHVLRHDWSMEDERLSQAISNLAPDDNMSLTAIAQLVHDRGHLKRKLDHLPKTKALLIELGKVAKPPQKNTSR
ncbi:Transposon Tn7 transposition protein D [Psychromonas ingrahamii 37]|uniref:Transposon Tn7 transposition protein D n=1 Tax=Psychromonas ingrahamii (strain DSM 17664 / CCUG 51855 / 37) TaxID=357804 RepID=A1SZ87_PSYIN|nr:TnsD family Tn7-like transposition protein [Psychromonas ingrahamii]ABM04802.1 Transposon Tn7 transposition protein D [Psychromonas ingrahamii 37]